MIFDVSILCLQHVSYLPKNIGHEFYNNFEGFFSCYQEKASVLQPWALEALIGSNFTDVFLTWRQSCRNSTPVPWDHTLCTGRVGPSSFLLWYCLNTPSEEKPFLRTSSPVKACESSVILLPVWFACRHFPLTDNIQHSTCYFLLSLITASIPKGMEFLSSPQSPVSIATEWK